MAERRKMFSESSPSLEGSYGGWCVSGSSCVCVPSCIVCVWQYV